MNIIRYKYQVQVSPHKKYFMYVNVHSYLIYSVEGIV